MRKTISLFLAVVLVFSLFLTGCGGKPTDDKPADKPKEDTQNQEDTKNGEEANSETEDDKPTSLEEITEFKQSPMLDDKNLPSVAERLPKEPKLTNEMPPDMLDYEVGTYGGTLRTVTSVVDWDADVFVMNNEPLLNTPGIVGEEITGNVLKGYDVTDDQKEFTFYMREGLKWSDGELVTSEDVRFTVEDVLFDKELTPVFPAWLQSGARADGNPVKFELVDQYTFKLIFDEPYGGLPIRIAIRGWVGYTELIKPAHFLKKYHKKYADAGQLAAETKKAGFQEKEWYNLFHSKDVTNWELTKPEAIGFPMLYPWMLVKSSKTSYVYERNPYYFKIDPDGNQLPYIDRIESTLVQDIEMVTMKTISGEVDFCRESAALVKMPLYKENEKNGYKALLSNMHVTPTDISLNLTHKDPVWRQVVQDVRFRKALNLALNRSEIIDAIYFGHAEPSKMIDSTFNLDEANRLLDEMGMKKGADGFRLGPDGKKFTIPIEHGAHAPDMTPLAELIVEHWKQLGLDVTMKTIDQGLWGTRNAANELKATIMWSHTPLWYMGDFTQGIWGPLWDQWYNSGGKKGEEPPEDVKKFYELIDKVTVSPPDEARQAVQEIKELMGKNIWYFVHIEDVKQPLIVNEKLGNVTDKGFAIGVNFAGEQFFFKK